MVPTVLEALKYRATDRDPRGHPVPHRGRQPGAHLRRRRRSDQAPHPVLRDVRPPLAVPRRMARGVPVPRPVVHRGRGELRQLELTEEKLREIDATRWELYHVDVDPAETDNLAEKERPRADRNDRHVVHRGGQVQRAAAGQSRHDAVRRRAATAHPRAQSTCISPAPRWFRRTWRPRCSTAHTRITVDVEIGDGDRACCSPTAAMSAATRSSSRTASCTTCTTTSAPRNCTSAPASRSLPAGTRCATSSSPPGHPDLKNGKGTPGHAQLFVDDALVGEADFDVTVPLALGIGGGAVVGRNAGSTDLGDVRAAVPIHRERSQP